MDFSEFEDDNESDLDLNPNYSNDNTEHNDIEYNTNLPNDNMSTDLNQQLQNFQQKLKTMIKFYFINCFWANIQNYFIVHDLINFFIFSRSIHIFRHQNILGINYPTFFFF